MSSGSENREIGALGESLAARYLVKQGYKLIARNYAVQGVGEIDIIAHKNGTLYFVEVKSSETYSLESEEHAVKHFDSAKKDKVVRAMRKYCDEHDVTIPRTVSLAAVTFSRETKFARVHFEPFILIDTI